MSRFKDAMRDKAFVEALEADGLPSLYPTRPSWAFVPGFAVQLMKKKELTKAFLRTGLEPGRSQQNNDHAWSHVKLLAARQRLATPGMLALPGYWISTVFNPAGCNLDEYMISCHFQDDTARISVDDFMRAVSSFEGVYFGWDAGPKCPPEARRCDNTACNAITPCVCACGESYCSRACLKTNWKAHAPLCHAVHQNNQLAYEVLNMYEFGYAGPAARRGPDAPPRANKWLCSVCAAPGARFQCKGRGVPGIPQFLKNAGPYTWPYCKLRYCGRWCQEVGWRGGHKRYCPTIPKKATLVVTPRLHEELG